ncbi:MAG: DUF3524 domain-containing protein [bacterium]|nr:DUF3524 domain-containing protein [bacterium]
MDHGEKGRLQVLVLEPYYGGSHKAFLKGLTRLPLTFDLMNLPARKWKWRMRLAAPHYGEILHRSGRHYDRILCSPFLDVAAFRGLGPRWVRDVPLLTYFHENQFAYPVQVEDERDFHFALTNMTTALSSDRIAFNSTYNLRSFMDGISRLLKQSHDLRLDHPCESIREKSQVLAPGIDFSQIDAAPELPRGRTPVVVWNHRWEHDKNPETFFNALFRLDNEGQDFKLVVLGKAYREHPTIFDEARKRLAHRILHVGYAQSSADYARWLKQGDLVISTADHEFFGMAILEAVRAGCRPLLPRRLSYPELFPPCYLYDEGDFLQQLRQLLLNPKRLSPDRSRSLTDRFAWKRVGRDYQAWIEKD